MLSISIICHIRARSSTEQRIICVTSSIQVEKLLKRLCYSAHLTKESTKTVLYVA